MLVLDVVSQYLTHSYVLRVGIRDGMERRKEPRIKRGVVGDGDELKSLLDWLIEQHAYYASVLMRQQNRDDRFTGITWTDNELQCDQFRFGRVTVTGYPIQLEQ